MRYTVTKQRIEILGTLWMPGVNAGTVRDLSPYDMHNLGDPENRDDVERWICLNSGDFSNIVDFHADFDVDGKHVEHPWAAEEHELEFMDAVYPSEE